MSWEREILFHALQMVGFWYCWKLNFTAAENFMQGSSVGLSKCQIVFESFMWDMHDSFFMHCKWLDFDAVESWILMLPKTLCKNQTLDCQNVKLSLKVSCEICMIFVLPNMCYVECWMRALGQCRCLLNMSASAWFLSSSWLYLDGFHLAVFWRVKCCFFQALD